MIMNITSNNSSNSHGDHHHHRSASMSEHHHHHHHLHSNGSSSSFIGDILSGEAGADTAEPHFRSRLSMVQDENAINYRSPPSGSYFPHYPLGNGMPFSHHHHSLVPVVEELMSSHAGYHGAQKGPANVNQAFYQQQGHLTSDNSPVPATSATSALAPSSPPPPTSASSSPPKRPFSEYDHHPSAYHHNEVVGGSGNGQKMVSNISTGGNTTLSCHLNGNSTAAPASVLTGIAGAKVPLADHNGQPSSFSENVCYGCRETLATSRIIVSVSGYHNYHTNCLCCSECGQSLCASETCYIRNGRMYCKEDYAKLVKCSKCNRQISADDWVRKAGELVYHLACFACDLCHRQLSTGENFTIVRQSQTEWRLLCKLHFLIKNDDESHIIGNHNCSPDADQESPNGLSGTGTTTVVTGALGESAVANGSSGMVSASGALTPTGQRTASSSSSSLSAASSKTKRVRTTFTEEQLSVLQANFQLDSNPDGQDLERIATLTGLSKRVTQVWFQNSRARQKKYMNKNHQRHSPGGGLLTPTGNGNGPSGGVAMLLNGGNGQGGLWSPNSSTGSSNNDCMGGGVHSASSSQLTLDCLNNGSVSGGTGGLSRPTTPKWAQSHLNHNMDSNVSSQCTESEHSSSPHM